MNVWCLIIDDGKLYSGSYDSTIKIWNCSTDTLIKTLTGHTGAVMCLTINDGMLYSGSWDRSIKVWNCSNHELITTLGVPEEHDEEGEYEGHTGYVIVSLSTMASCTLVVGIRQSRCGTAAPISSLLPLQSILILYIVYVSMVASCTLRLITSSRCMIAATILSLLL